MGRFGFTIQTKQDLINAVNKLRFLPLFENSIPGFSVEENVEPSLWFGSGPGPWEWKGRAYAAAGCGGNGYTKDLMARGGCFPSKEQKESSTRCSWVGLFL